MSWSKANELVLPLGIIGCLLVFLVPLPPGLMDVLLAGNIAIGLVVLLTTFYVRAPLEFSVFPTVLLATTLARLVLNVATTRLILTDADKVGLDAAGEVIRQFGQYVSGDRLIVGIVIFAIIFVIQMLVITKGATRISEVAARFSLDGIPGRQLAIDADLNANVIDQHEAQRRRAQLNRQADFYGAMDGASKFVRGDAIAGAFITLINILGGLLIGLTQSSMSFTQTIDVYTKLTIGDGLVSQIPALLISLAAGLLVTRSSEETNLPVEFLRQLFTKPQVLGVAGIFLSLLVFTQLPKVPLLLLAALFLSLAYVAARRKLSEPERTAKPTSKPKPRPDKEQTKRLEDYLQVDALELELGRALVNVANAARGGDLLARIKATREHIASDLGLIMPSVRVRDNSALSEEQYAIRLAGNVVATGKVPRDGIIVVPPRETKSRSLPGAVPFDHPAMQQRAKLIPVELAGDAKALGCQLVSTSSLITQHLLQVVHRFAHELLTRDAAKHLIEEARRNSPAVVDELIPELLRLNQVQHVLQGLLREGVPIRQLSRILESLGDYAATTKDTRELIELTRRRLARTITARYRDDDGLLNVVTLDPELEDQLVTAIRQHREMLSVAETMTFQEKLRKTLERLLKENHPPVLLTQGDLRLAVLEIARAVVPNVIVLGQEEISVNSPIRSVGIVGLA